MKRFYTIKIYRVGFILPVLFLLNTALLSENPKLTKQYIYAKYNEIMNASKMFDINYKYLAAVIYIERTSNYDWTDATFDDILARLGRNSSLGFCQVKLKTAYFIEKQFNDSKSIYYPGEKYENIIHISHSSDELIKKLKTDKLNIIYAAAYIKIIIKYWSNSGFNIENNPEIIGTLYQTGLFNLDGSARIPNACPRPNAFGLKVLEAIPIFTN